MSSLMTILIIVLILAFAAFLNGRRKMKEAGTWMGIKGTVPEFLWNGGSRSQRKLMLFSIGITDDDSKQERLLSLRWTRLPHSVQLGIFKVVEARRAEGFAVREWVFCCECYSAKEP